MLRKVYIDFVYSGEDMKNRMLEYGIEVEVVGRRYKKTFEMEPKRWIIERTFSWLGKFRRLSKDYELITNTSLNMIYQKWNLLRVPPDAAW
jgi:putative transposase